MGDRANIQIKEDGENDIFLYTHWEGYCLPSTLQTALKRGEDRWGDPAYLNRIIFSEMIKNKVNELTGYGIAPYPCDEDADRILVLDHTRGTVTVQNAGRAWMFMEFCTLNLDGDADQWEIAKGSL